MELAVRIGIHTGPVVVGEMGGGGRHENLALGETPNIAARLEGLAPANTVVISPVTAQLVQRSFIIEELGLHELKGVAEPMMLYVVVNPRPVPGAPASSHGHATRSSLSGGQGLSGGGAGQKRAFGMPIRWSKSRPGPAHLMPVCAL